MPPAILRETEFKNRLSTAEYLGACRRALQLYGEGALDNPPRAEGVEDGVFRLEMPCAWPGHFRARKVIEEVSDPGSGRLGQRQAYIDLEDLKRNTRVRLEADHITDMRTGAAGALGLELLADGPLRRIGLVGTGRGARSLALAADSLLGPAELRVTSRTAQSRQAFVEDLGGRLGCKLVAVDSLQACLDGVDALLVAVPTPKPILDWPAVRRVPLLAIIGGDGRTRQLAPEILRRAQVVVDMESQAQKSGEFAHALAAGDYDAINFCRVDSGRVAHIGDAACGQLSFTEAGEKVPRLAYFTGLAALDLFAAVAVYERLCL